MRLHSKALSENKQNYGMKKTIMGPEFKVRQRLCALSPPLTEPVPSLPTWSHDEQAKVG